VLQLEGGASSINMNGAKLQASCATSAKASVKYFNMPQNLTGTSDPTLFDIGEYKAYLVGVPTSCGGFGDLSVPCASREPSYPALFTCVLSGAKGTVEADGLKANATAVKADDGRLLDETVWVTCPLPSLSELNRITGEDTSPQVAMIASVKYAGSELPFTGLTGGDGLVLIGTRPPPSPPVPAPPPPSSPSVHTSCTEAKERGADTDGFYDIKLGGKEYSIYCDMTTSNGPWALTYMQKNDNDGDAGPDFFSNLKKGGEEFPKTLNGPSAVASPIGGSRALRDAMWQASSSKAWRATAFNGAYSTSSKKIDVYSDSNFRTGNPLLCYATGCLSGTKNDCSNSDCSDAKALMSYGPYSPGSSVTLYVFGNQFCNCWEVVSAGASGSCQYRVTGDFINMHCSSSMTYTEHSAFWIRF